MQNKSSTSTASTNCLLRFWFQCLWLSTETRKKRFQTFRYSSSVNICKMWQVSQIKSFEWRLLTITAESFKLVGKKHIHMLFIKMVVASRLCIHSWGKYTFWSARLPRSDEWHCSVRHSISSTLCCLSDWPHVFHSVDKLQKILPSYVREFLFL